MGVPIMINTSEIQGGDRVACEEEEPETPAGRHRGGETARGCGFHEVSHW